VIDLEKPKKTDDNSNLLQVKQQKKDYQLSAPATNETITSSSKPGFTSQPSYAQRRTQKRYYKQPTKT